MHARGVGHRPAGYSHTLTSHGALVAAQVFSDNVTEVNFRPEDGRANAPPQPVPQLSMGDMRKDLVFLDIASDPAFTAIQQVRAPGAVPLRSVCFGEGPLCSLTAVAAAAGLLYQPARCEAEWLHCGAPCFRHSPITCFSLKPQLY